MSRVFATGLGDQNMVIEDVAIETETSRGKRPKTGEVLVFTVRPKGIAGGPVLAVPQALPGLRRREGRDTAVAHPGCRDDQDVSAGRGAAGGMPRTWGGGGAVPWARPGAGHTWASRTRARGWPRMPRECATVLLRIAWRTVAAIVARVVADGRDTNDRLAGLSPDRYRRDRLPQGPPLLISYVESRHGACGPGSSPRTEGYLPACR